MKRKQVPSLKWSKIIVQSVRAMNIISSVPFMWQTIEWEKNSIIPTNLTRDTTKNIVKKNTKENKRNIVSEIRFSSRHSHSIWEMTCVRRSAQHGKHKNKLIHRTRCETHTHTHKLRNNNTFFFGWFSSFTARICLLLDILFRLFGSHHRTELLRPRNHAIYVFFLQFIRFHSIHDNYQVSNNNKKKNKTNETQKTTRQLGSNSRRL